MSSGKESHFLKHLFRMEHMSSPPCFSPLHCPPPQIVVLIGIAHALVIYRVVATALFTQSDSEFFREQANLVAVMTGAVLHYITIVVMTKVQNAAWGGQWVLSFSIINSPFLFYTSLLQINRRVALFLCDLGKGNWGLPSLTPHKAAQW